MNNGVAFLAIALGVSVVGSLLLWLRHRKPTTFMSSIDEFHREMEALGGDPASGRRGRRKRAHRPEPIVPAPESGDLARRLREARQRGGHAGTMEH
jgi:hypothetical protein